MAQLQSFVPVSVRSDNSTSGSRENDHVSVWGINSKFIQLQWDKHNLIHALYGGTRVTASDWWKISQKCLLRQNSQRSSLPVGCCAHLCAMSSADPHFAEMQCSCWGYRPWKDPWVRPWPAGCTAGCLSTSATCHMNPDRAKQLRVLHTPRGLKVCARRQRWRYSSCQSTNQYCWSVLWLRFINGQKKKINAHIGSFCKSTWAQRWPWTRATLAIFLYWPFLHTFVNVSLPTFLKMFWMLKYQCVFSKYIRKKQQQESK